MSSRHKSSIAKIFTLPVRLRKGSAISEQDVVTAMACSKDLALTLCNALPAELQMLILQDCSFEDIMKLRCVSRGFCNMVTLHGAFLFRHFTQDGEMAQMADLYRCAVLPRLEPSFYNFCGLRHRAIIADKLAEFVVMHRMCEKARIQPFVLRQDPCKIVELRVAVIRLRPFFFILYHFFEALRANLVRVSEHKGACRDDNIDSAVRLVQRWLLGCYEPGAISCAMRLWEQIMKIVYRKFRPATYATVVERSLRGWNHPAASENDISDLLIFGGLEALHRVITIRGFASRMKAFDKIVLQVQTPSESSSKDDMRTAFGVMPPLQMSAITFIRKRVQPAEHMNFMCRGEAAPTLSTPYTEHDEDLIRRSNLGTLAPVVEAAAEHSEPLVADTEGKEPESLELYLKQRTIII
ncbi:MAG: hypothetical protein Q9195_008265 [Heterodermia aff. obscurata]